MARIFFYDTEFIEEPGKIDLISIGIVSWDGQKKLYRGNNEIELPTEGWVAENVVPHLPPRDGVMHGFWLTKESIAEEAGGKGVIRVIRLLALVQPQMG